jgi:hypothetical protein
MRDLTTIRRLFRLFRFFWEGYRTKRKHVFVSTGGLNEQKLKGLDPLEAWSGTATQRRGYSGDIIVFGGQSFRRTSCGDRGGSDFSPWPP